MILACDPGLSGAFAEWAPHSLAVFDMPTVERQVGGRMKRVLDEGSVHDLLFMRMDRKNLLVIEQVGGIPSQSAPAAFTFGYGVGFIIGAAKALGYRVEHVAPSTWKSAMKVPADKDRARARASELLPAYAHLWTRQKDDGRAEAAIMALYGWEVFGGT